MSRIVQVAGKPVELAITPAAQRALAQREDVLCLELELYFSCLVRKRVHVMDSADAAEYIPLTERLSVRLRPVVTQTCVLREVESGNPPLQDMPVVHPERYFPHWLRLDFHAGRWRASFGYARMPA